MADKPIGERVAVMEQALIGVETLLEKQDARLTRVEKVMWSLGGFLLAVGMYTGVNVAPFIV